MTSKFSLRLLPALIFCACASLISCHSSTRGENSNLQFSADNDSLQLPSGFRVVVMAHDIGPARHIAVRQNGDVYIALNSRHNGGSIAALRDSSGDGKADQIVYFGALGGGTGIGIHDGYLYFGSDTAVV